jgi:Mce-associated membrane protein
MPPDTDPAVEDPETVSQDATAKDPPSGGTPTKAGTTGEASTTDETSTPGEASTTDEASTPGEAEDAEQAGDAGPDGDGSTAQAEPDGPGSRPGRRLLAAAAVAVVLLGGLGGWATWKAHGLRAAAAQRNVALTDRTQTSAVAHQVASAVNTIFSYSYADTARTRQAAQSLLTGVEFLAGGRARLLVFANQQDTKGGTTQSSYAGAMFAVTAVQQGGHWKIESIDTFTGN